MGGVLVGAVTSVDDVRLNALGEKLSGPGCAMSHDDHVDAHRLEVTSRIDECLALRHRRSRRRDVDGVSREPLLRELEGDAGASRRLEEEIDDRRPPEGRHLLDRPLADLLERLGGVENEPNLLRAERLEPQQVFAERTRHGVTRITASLPSRACTNTSTR